MRVHVCMQVCACGHGGECVCSQLAYDTGDKDSMGPGQLEMELAFVF